MPPRVECLDGPCKGMEISFDNRALRVWHVWLERWKPRSATDSTTLIDNLSFDTKENTDDN